MELNLESRFSHLIKTVVSDKMKTANTEFTNKEK